MTMEGMCVLDILGTAKNLKSLLIVHDKVVQKITDLDDQIDQINRRLLIQDLHIMSGQCSLYQQQISVLSGVRQMLDKYRLQKFHQIQTLSRSVIRSLSPDTVAMETTSTSTNDFENSTITMRMDMAAINYTALSRECYRTE